MNPGKESRSNLSTAPVELVLRNWRLFAALAAAGLLLNLTLVRLLSGGLIPGFSEISEPAWLLIAAVLVFLPWMTSSIRVMIWTRLFGKPLPFRSCAGIVAGADFSAAATPTAVGGFPAKTAFLVGEGFRPGDAVLIAGIGGFEDGLFFAFAVPTALCVAGGADMPVMLSALAGLDRTAVPISIVGLSALAVVILGKLVIRKKQLSAPGVPEVHSSIEASPGPGLRGRLSAVAAGVGSHARLEFSRTRNSARCLLARGPSSLLLTLPLACIGWTARYTAISAVAMAFGHHPDPIRLFALQWVTFSIMNLVPTPGASGGAEGSFILVHRGIIPDAMIGPVVLCWRFLTFYLTTVVAGTAFVLLSGCLARRHRRTTGATQRPIRLTRHA